jgi:PAS domain S-box-containing protein
VRLKISPSIGRCGLAILAALALAWSFNELSPLLVAIAAICIYLGRWQGLLSIAVLSLVFAVYILFPGSGDPVDLRLYFRVTALLASALTITLIVQNYQSAMSPQRADDDTRLIVENMPGLAWSTDPDGNFKFVNQSVMDYVGKPPDDLSRIEGSNDFGWRQVVHPDDVDHSVEQWLHCLKAGTPYEIEHRVRRFDGTYRWFRAVGRSSRDPGGRITGWYGTTIDIDDRKRAEDALRNSEQQLRLLIDTIPALVWCATPGGEPSYLNKRLTDYTGLTLQNFDDPEDKSRRSVATKALMHPDDISELQRQWSHSITTGESFSFRHRLRRADGVFRWVDSRREPLRDEEGRIVQWYCINFDVDDATHMQDALRTTMDRLARASQAASLAEMSASIAHEVNQPLAAIVNNSHACQQWLSAEPPNLQRAQVTIGRVIRDANSAADIVSRTRALFQRRALIKLPLNLNEVISEVLQVMNDEATAKAIRLHASLELDLPSIAADRVQMQQVLINLIRNGIDAMESADVAPKSISIRSCLHGTQMVLVEVRDQGMGVEDPERIFEPFFTTKEGGIGMGLAISRSIVEAHEGRLWAAQNNHGGTTFSFTLPMHRDDAA